MSRFAYNNGLVLFLHDPTTTSQPLAATKSQLNEALVSTAIENNLDEARRDPELCVESHQARMEMLKKKHRSETRDLHENFFDGSAVI